MLTDSCAMVTAAVMRVASEKLSAPRGVACASGCDVRIAQAPPRH